MIAKQSFCYWVWWQFYVVALREMIPGHHCFGVLTLTSWLQNLAPAIFASKKPALSHLCLLVLLLCRLLPYASTSVHVLTVQVEINLEKEMVEDKTFSFSRNARLCTLKLTMLLEKCEQDTGEPCHYQPSGGYFLLCFKNRKSLITCPPVSLPPWAAAAAWGKCEN